MILKIRILKLCYSNNKLGIKWVMRNVILHKLCAEQPVPGREKMVKKGKNAPRKAENGKRPK